MFSVDTTSRVMAMMTSSSPGSKPADNINLTHVAVVTQSLPPFTEMLAKIPANKWLSLCGKQVTHLNIHWSGYHCANWRRHIPPENSHFLGKANGMLSVQKVEIPKWNRNIAMVVNTYILIEIIN